MHIELNARTYIFAALLVMGLIFEVLKVAPSTPPSMATLEDNVLLSKPYAISEKTIRQAAQSMVNRIKAFPMPGLLPSFDFKGVIDKWQKEQDKAKADQKKKKMPKNWHWVWNKELNKWVWKKIKKKDADKKDTAATDQLAAPDTSSTANKPSTASPAAQPLIAAPTTTLPSAAIGGGVSAASTPVKFLSATEWETSLEQSPSNQKTDKFVQDFKSNLVTEPIFYQVVNHMLKSSNVAVQQQGLRALGEAPLSAQSFEILATESSSLQTSSPLYATTNQDLSAYGQPKNLQDLQSAMSHSASNSAVETVALNTLQTSIQTNLGTGGAQPSAQLVGEYKGFVPILTGLQSGSSSVASLASTVLNQLNQIPGL